MSSFGSLGNKVNLAMRHSIYHITILLALVCPLQASTLYQLAPASAVAAWSAPNASGVSVSAGGQDTVTWTYDKVKSGAIFRSLLAQPATIPAGIQRISFWVQGHGAIVKPIVTDARGQDFIYQTHQQGDGWRYASTLLINPYNGGRIGNSDIATFNGDGVPKAPLSFKGLEITTGSLSSDSISVRDIAFDLSKQSDPFAQWSLNNRCLKSIVPGAEEPFLLTTDLCRDSGRFQILWRAYDLSETRLLWQGQQDINYDPDHPAAVPGDRVRIPVLTPGTYSLKVSVIDRDADPTDIGARRDSSYRLHILRGEQIDPPLPAGTRPVGTLIGFNPQKAALVYLSKEPKVVTVRFWKPIAAGPYTWTYWWRAGAKPETGPTAAIDFGGKPFVDEAVTLANWDGAANPMASFGAQIASSAGVIERTQTSIGVAQDLPAAPLALSAAALSRDEVVKKYGNLVTVGNFAEDIFDCSQKDFETQVESLRNAGYNCYIFRLLWRRLNPLPGVGDFSILDQRVAYLDKIGMPYILQVNWSFTDQPDWLDFNVMEDQSAETNVWQGQAQLPSPSDQKLRAGISGLIHLLQAHYIADKNLIAYEFLGVGCDWLQPDAPYLGVTVDYSPSARTAFQRYLRDVKGETIATLNTRYGSSYKSLADVPLPSPNFTPDPDFSPQWRDFMNFKHWFSTDYIEFLARTVRSMDQRRYISLYAMGGVWMPLDIVKKEGISLANGGGEGEHQPIPRYSHEYQHGIADRSESVSCEFSSEFRLDSVIFNMLSIGGLGTSINNFFRGGSPVYTGDDGARQMAYWQTWMKILDELKDAKPTFDDVAMLASPDSLFYQDRTIFGDVAWYPEWEQGKKIANEENLRPYWVYEEDIPLSLPGKRLAVLIGQYSRIVEPVTIPRLVDYVKQGGVLVIDLTSGDRVPDPSGKPYELWRALGLPTPQSSPGMFDETATRYYAQIADGSGIGTAGGTIAFDDSVNFASSIPGATPLFKDSNGRIVCWQFHLGSGSIIAFPGKLNYPKSAPFLGALYRKLGGRVPVTPSLPEIKTEWLTMSTAKYLVAHRYLGQGYIGDASADARIRALGVQSGTIALNALNAGTYKVECLTGPTVTPLTATADELHAAGVPFTLHCGETAVWRITAVH